MSTTDPLLMDLESIAPKVVEMVVAYTAPELLGLVKTLEEIAAAAYKALADKDLTAAEEKQIIDLATQATIRARFPGHS